MPPSWAGRQPVSPRIEMMPVAVGPGAATGQRDNPGNVDVQAADLRDSEHGGDEREVPLGQTACPPYPRVRRYGAAPYLVESSVYPTSG